MALKRGLSGIFVLLAVFASYQRAAANTYKIILKGKVMMEDGTPPPFTLAVERYCSDSFGSGPGPLTNRKGEYVWQLEVDPLATKACFLRATHAGYTSTSIDVGSLDVTKTVIELPPVTISTAVPDPYALIVSENNLTGKTKSPWNAAMKALDNSNFAEAASQLQTAVSNSPKFAEGWHALGVVDERLQKQADARQAYEHAIDANPKLLVPYVTLARLCLKTKDWDCTIKTADSLNKADAKKLYPEIYLHRAVAQYQTKDLAGAESSVQDYLKLDPKHKKPRAEYVLGRILEAKGDAAGAKEHMAKYLELDPGATDKSAVQAHLQSLGQSGATAPDPELEPL
jgi:cytochrome c-type biogenesis protein CcmH/NrfG